MWDWAYLQYIYEPSLVTSNNIGALISQRNSSTIFASAGAEPQLLVIAVAKPAIDPEPIGAPNVHANPTTMGAIASIATTINIIWTTNTRSSNTPNGWGVSWIAVSAVYSSDATPARIIASITRPISSIPGIVSGSNDVWVPRRSTRRVSGVDVKRTVGRFVGFAFGALVGGDVLNCSCALLVCFGSCKQVASGILWMRQSCYQSMEGDSMPRL